jgi:hypothetical protein
VSVLADALRWWWALLAAGVLGVLLLVPGTAGAIPDSGAGPDTPGTSASVSPRQLTAGAVISFRLSGFPGGETVYVKIDDGRTCSASAVHGACVVHQQAIPSSGTVTGSFALPRDLPKGAHWLRFLASKEVIGADGSYRGIKGYTRRGGADFTIVAGRPTGTPTGSTGADGGQDPSAPATEDDAVALTAGETLVVEVPRGRKGGRAADAARTPAVTQAPEPEPVPVAAEPEEGESLADASEGPVGGVPVVGLLCLALLLAAAGVLLRNSARRGTR